MIDKRNKPTGFIEFQYATDARAAISCKVQTFTDAIFLLNGGLMCRSQDRRVLLKVEKEKQHIIQEGVVPNSETFLALLQAYANDQTEAGPLVHTVLSLPCAKTLESLLPNILYCCKHLHTSGEAVCTICRLGTKRNANS